MAPAAVACLYPTLAPHLLCRRHALRCRIGLHRPAEVFEPCDVRRLDAHGLVPERDRLLKTVIGAQQRGQVDVCIRVPRVELQYCAQ